MWEDRWISLSNVNNHYNLHVDLLVMEQILNNCSAGLRDFLKERDYANTTEMSEAAVRG